jgi:tetratricopeptide (TPR) repeat protein
MDGSSPMRWARPALMTIAVLAMVIHCWRFRDFTVDDAAISYAYSQSFAHGAGIVATAGGERVEGYSNFLWVILVGGVTALFGHVLVVGKVLGLLFAVAITLGSAELLAALRRRRSALDALPAFLGAAFLPIPYWSMSGLENPLYLTLTIWCCVRLVQEARATSTGPAPRPWSALLAAAAALTRPDGLLVAVTALAAQLGTRRQRRQLHLWLALAVTPVVAHLAWRYRYYAYPWPNTFYVKVAFPFQLRELFDLHSRGWKYLIGFGAQYRLTPLLLMTPLALVNRPIWPRLVLFAMVATVLFFPIYARGDWMSEGRFAVDAVPLLFVLASDGVLGVARLARRLPTGARGGVALGVVLSLGLAATIVPHSLALSAARVHNYPVPVQVVAQRARKYRAWAQTLEVAHPSVADGDAGGNLLYAAMPLIDIGWLTDGTLSHWGRNPGFVREYIFGERRPTFMRITGYWRGSHLQDYPEFAEYVPAPQEDGIYLARSALTTDAVATTHPLAPLTETLDLLGYELNLTAVRVWVRTKSAQPTVAFSLHAASPRMGSAETPLDGGHDLYPPAQWRAGEIIELSGPRSDGADLQLCLDETQAQQRHDKRCWPLDHERAGAQPVTWPRPTSAAIERLLARGELEAARAALARNGQSTRAVGRELYRRALAADHNGQSDRAFADFAAALQADPSLSLARRRLEELRTAPRAGYHPGLATRLADAIRKFQEAPERSDLGLVAQLARAAGEPERVVSLQLASALLPATDAGRLELAECYFDVGLPDEAAALLPRAASDERDQARVERIARAAGRTSFGPRPAHPATAEHWVANGIALKSVSGRLRADGTVLLDLVLLRNADAAIGTGDASDTIQIAGRPHVWRRPPRRWAEGERVLETIAVDAPAGHSLVVIGSSVVALDVAPFSADFERGRLDGWTATGSAFEQQPRDQRWHEAFGTQGDRYLHSSESGVGRLTSPPLGKAVSEVCFVIGGKSVFLQGEEVSSPNATSVGELAEPRCLHKPAGGDAAWHIVIVDGGETERVTADDFSCYGSDGSAIPCAGSVTARFSSSP